MFYYQLGYTWQYVSAVKLLQIHLDLQIPTIPDSTFAEFQNT